MKHLKIAYSFDVQYYFVDSDRDIVPVEQTDFTDIAVAVLSDQDFSYIDKIDATGFGVPIMVIMLGGGRLPARLPISSTTSVNGTTPSIARATRTVPSSASIQPAAIFMISMDHISSRAISAMPTSPWGTCSSTKGRPWRRRTMLPRSSMPTRPILSWAARRRRTGSSPMPC